MVHYRVVLSPKNSKLLHITNTKILFGDAFDIDNLDVEFTLLPNNHKFRFVNNYEHGFYMKRFKRGTKTDIKKT